VRAEINKDLGFARIERSPEYHQQSFMAVGYATERLSFSGETEQISATDPAQASWLKRLGLRNLCRRKSDAVSLSDRKARTTTLPITAG